MAEPVLVVENLYYRYPTRTSYALEDVSLSIERGEFLAIIGQNGSGKTTLIKHFNGLLKPTQGGSSWKAAIQKICPPRSWPAR
jgi:energy-coupling factor transporter ATP-binding protein EcfA2